MRLLNAGKLVVELTGDVTPDARAIAAANVIGKEQSKVNKEWRRGGGAILRYSYCRTEYSITIAKKMAGNSVILIKISIKDLQEAD